MYLNKTTPAIRLEEAATEKAIFAWQSGVGAALNCEIGDLTLTASESTAKQIYLSIFGNNKLSISNTAITTSVGLLLGSHKIEGLADPESAQDAATKNYVDTGFFPLAAGSGSKLTGDLYLNKTTPAIRLEEAATEKAIFAWQSGVGAALNCEIGDLTLTASESTAKQIYLSIFGNNKLSISNTAITTSVDVVLGTNKLRGTAGGGSDVIFGDDISMLKAVSTYGDIKNTGNITPGVTGTKDLGSSSLKFKDLYISGNVNQSNLLSGITPTLTNFAVTPATNAEITDELIVDQTPTTAGRITASTTGYMVYDLGSSKRIIVHAYSYISNPNANPVFALDLSDDNTNFHTATFERVEAYYPNITTIGKARYVRLRIAGHASVQTVLNELSIRCYTL